MPKLIDDPRLYEHDATGNKDPRLRTTATGTFVFSGLSTSWINTTLSIGTVATALPTSPLSNRNFVAVQNFDDLKTVYIGLSNVTAGRNIGSTTDGWEIGPNETLNLDITDNITVYAIVSSGTATVKVMELA